jgi:hypothetical protein
MLTDQFRKLYPLRVKVRSFKIFIFIQSLKMGEVKRTRELADLLCGCRRSAGTIGDKSQTDLYSSGD